MHPSCNYTRTDSLPFGAWKVRTNVSGRHGSWINSQDMEQIFVAALDKALENREIIIKPCASVSTSCIIQCESQRKSTTLNNRLHLTLNQSFRFYGGFEEPPKEMKCFRYRVTPKLTSAAVWRILNKLLIQLNLGKQLLENTNSWC